MLLCDIEDWTAHSRIWCVLELMTIKPKEVYKSEENLKRNMSTVEAMDVLVVCSLSFGVCCSPLSNA